MQPAPWVPSVVFLSMVCRVPTRDISNLLFRADSSSSADAAIVTPTSSECDESVTIHADPAVVSASLDSSPSVKKEKKETV